MSGHIRSLNMTQEKNDEQNDKQDNENGQNSEVEVNYDELLSSAGEFGRYQLFLQLSTVPFYMFGVYVLFSQMFITESSKNHWCWIPELGNLSVTERRNLAIPKDDSIYGYSRCTAYAANWTEVLTTGQLPNNTWETSKCQHGWEFNKTEIPYPTIGSEEGWVCDKSSYQAIAQSLYAVGSIVGGFIIGWIGDRYGRIPAAVTGNLLGCIGGVTSTFTKSFIQFSFCRFIMGMAYDNCFIMVYLIMLEYVAPKYRTLMANLTFAIFFSFFLTTLPFIALALGDWKLISLFTSIPLGFAVFTPLLIPESPRWLLSKGRVEEAVKKVLAIGRINRKEVPRKLIQQFKTTISKEKHVENRSLLEVLKRPVLRKILILSCLLNFCITGIVFDGLVRIIGQLDFDFFLSFAAISFTEFPSMLLAAFVMDLCGRRWLTFIVMSLSCVFTILINFAGNGIQSVCFAILARFTTNIGASIILQWGAEVLPTEVRGSGVAVAHVCGFVGTTLTPYIAYLNIYVHWLPFIIIASVAELAAVAALFLPETAKKELPDTFDDAENLMLSQQFWKMPCDRKRKISESAEQVNPTFEM